MPLLSLHDVLVLGQEKIHPEKQLITDLTAAICNEFGIKRNIFHEYTTMVLFMFPKVSDINRLVNINVINDVLFYIDDMYSDDRMLFEDTELREIFQNTLLILEGKLQLNNHHLYKIAHRLRTMISDTPLAWQKRFIAALKGYFYFTTDRLEDLKHEGKIPLGKYIHHREYVSGMYTTIVEIEYANDAYLPDSLIASPQIQRIQQICAQYCSLLNDIFSYHKEVILVGTEYNYLYVLQKSKNIGFEEAIHEAVIYLNALIAEFQILESQLLSSQNSAYQDILAIYLDGIKDQMDAAWYWQWSTNRYRSPQSPIKELRSLLPVIKHE